MPVVDPWGTAAKAVNRAREIADRRWQEYRDAGSDSERERAYELFKVAKADEHAALVVYHALAESVRTRGAA